MIVDNTRLVNLLLKDNSISAAAGQSGTGVMQLVLDVIGVGGITYWYVMDGLDNL